MAVGKLSGLQAQAGWQKPSARTLFGGSVQMTMPASS